MKEKKKKIGEILLENKFITRQMLNEALEYQQRFGGSITQYLIACGYINEEELATSLCEQFGLPYLPISVYEVSDEVLKLVPAEIVQKYCLMPIDKMEDIITIVMSNPVDADAIGEIEAITNCKVQPFVGIFSDIIKAIEKYYHVIIGTTEIKGRKPTPLFIDTEGYKGLDRRKSVRINAKLDIHFPMQETYKRSRIKNLSLDGFLFESDNILPVGSYITLQMDLPKGISPYSISAVVQVVRIDPLPHNRFDVGARIVKMASDDIKALIKYSQMEKEEA
jgi:hypothetical protein